MPPIRDGTSGIRAVTSHKKNQKVEFTLKQIKIEVNVILIAISKLLK